MASASEPCGSQAIPNLTDDQTDPNRFMLHVRNRLEAVEDYHNLKTDMQQKDETIRSRAQLNEGIKKGVRQILAGYHQRIAALKRRFDATETALGQPLWYLEAATEAYGGEVYPWDPQDCNDDLQRLVWIIEALQEFMGDRPAMIDPNPPIDLTLGEVSRTIREKKKKKKEFYLPIAVMDRPELQLPLLQARSEDTFRRRESGRHEKPRASRSETHQQRDRRRSYSPERWRRRTHSLDRRRNRGRSRRSWSRSSSSPSPPRGRRDRRSPSRERNRSRSPERDRRQNPLWARPISPVRSRSNSPVRRRGRSSSGSDQSQSQARNRASNWRHDSSPSQSRHGTPEKTTRARTVVAGGRNGFSTNARESNLSRARRRSRSRSASSSSSDRGRKRHRRSTRSRSRSPRGRHKGRKRSRSRDRAQKQPPTPRQRRESDDDVVILDVRTSNAPASKGPTSKKTPASKGQVPCGPAPPGQAAEASTASSNAPDLEVPAVKKSFTALRNRWDVAPPGVVPPQRPPVANPLRLDFPFENQGTEPASESFASVEPASAGLPSDRAPIRFSLSDTNLRRPLPSPSPLQFAPVPIPSTITGDLSPPPRPPVQFDLPSREVPAQSNWVETPFFEDTDSNQSIDNNNRTEATKTAGQVEENRSRKQLVGFSKTLEHLGIVIPASTNSNPPNRAAPRDLVPPLKPPRKPLLANPEVPASASQLLDSNAFRTFSKLFVTANYTHRAPGLPTNQFGAPQPTQVFSNAQNQSSSTEVPMEVCDSGGDSSRDFEDDCEIVFESISLSKEKDSSSGFRPQEETQSLLGPVHMILREAKIEEGRLIPPAILRRMKQLKEMFQRKLEAYQFIKGSRRKKIEDSLHRRRPIAPNADPCLFCREAHLSDACHKYPEHEQRASRCQELDRCEGCVQPYHKGPCKVSRECSVCGSSRHLAAMCQVYKWLEFEMLGCALELKRLHDGLGTSS